MLGPSNRNLWLLYGSRTENDFLTDEYLTYEWVDPGEVLFVRETGFRYQVLADDATDEDLAVGEVKLRVLPGPDGSYNFGAWAPAGDNMGDDSDKLQLALDNIPPKSKLFIPEGYYLIGKTIILYKPVHLCGNNFTGSGPTSPEFGDTVLRWPAGVTGMVAQSGMEDGDLGNAIGTMLEGLEFRGSGPVVVGEAHGIWARTFVMMKHCLFRFFSGNGIHIVAGIGVAGIRGNANHWTLERVRCVQNGGHGLYVRGADANAGSALACDFSTNARFGIRDHSFLGNFYYACHTATNGLGGPINQGGASSVVHYDGARYYAIWERDSASGAFDEMTAGQMQRLVDTIPGTDPSVWGFHSNGGAGTAYPTWLPDQPVGTYFLGGGVMITNINSATKLDGLYSESDEAGNILYGNNVGLEGGLNGVPRSGGRVTYRNGGELGVRRLTSKYSNTTAALNFPLPDAAFGWNNPEFDLSTGNENWWSIRPATNTNWKAWLLANGGSYERVAFYISYAATDLRFGTPDPIPYQIGFPRIALGQGQNARRQTVGTAIPTTGAWARGDIIWNINASPGGNAGWICTTAGTPGTWKAFGAIDA